MPTYGFNVMAHTPSGSDSRGRAERFTLHLPVWYRVAGEAEWRSGTTENISASGAAIRGDQPVEARTPVRVIIPLPSPGTESVGCLTGRGRVVRRVVLPSQPDASAFAVSITRYRLDSRGRALNILKS